LAESLNDEHMQESLLDVLNKFDKESDEMKEPKDLFELKEEYKILDELVEKLKTSNINEDFVEMLKNKLKE